MRTCLPPGNSKQCSLYQFGSDTSATYWVAPKSLQQKPIVLSKTHVTATDMLIWKGQLNSQLLGMQFLSILSFQSTSGCSYPGVACMLYDSLCSMFSMAALNTWHLRPHMCTAGSPAAILARQQQLAGTARRQLHMSRFTSPVPAQLGARKPESRSGVQVLSKAGHQQSRSQQQSSQEVMQAGMTQEASQPDDAQSDGGEIFPAAVPEGAEEAAAGGKLPGTGSDTGGISAAVNDNVKQAAAEAFTTSAQDLTLADTNATADATEADTDSAVISGAGDQLGGNQSVSPILQHAVSVADASDADITAAVMLSEESDPPSDAARAEVAAQQNAMDVLPGGSDTQEQCGMQYPWMDHPAVSSAPNEQGHLARTAPVGDGMQPPHVTFASGGMTHGMGSKIPMSYLAAAAADRRMAAKEAAAAAAASAAAERRSAAGRAAAAEAAEGRSAIGRAAAAEAAERRSPTERAAEAEAEPGTAARTAMQNVVVTQAGSADVGEQIRQAAEQEWSQSIILNAQPQAATVLLESGKSSALPSSQPPAYKLSEPQDDRYSMDKRVLGHAQDGAEAMKDNTEGNEQSDAMSVASFANSAASGLGHLLRAQQPWSESSSSPDRTSPDRTSTTGSAGGMRDISQLEAEVMSQPDLGHQLPQQLTSPDQGAVSLGDQLPTQILLNQEQPQHAQHGLWQHQEVMSMTGAGEGQQQTGWHEADPAESEHDQASSVPLAALGADASTLLIDHTTGK